MKFVSLLPLTLLGFMSFAALAVVKRHDISPDLYELKSAPDFFVNMPHEGSAVLIDKQWLLSAGHVIYYDGYQGKSINIHGVENEIEQIIFHPNFVKQSENQFVDDAKPLMSFLYGRTDLVLIKLKNPVNHVSPIKRYRKTDEIGKQTITYGTGATGTGITGEDISSKSKRALNFFNNQIESIEGHYLKMRFDRPTKGLALEGIHGSGDSGGPTVLVQDGEQYLIGIQSFRDFYGNLKDFKGGVYDSVSVLCRISDFNQWIDQTIESGLQQTNRKAEKPNQG